MSSEQVKYTSVQTWQTKPVYVHRNAAGQASPGLAAWLLSHEARHYVPLHDKSPLSTTGISVAYLHMNGVCRIQIQLITEGLMHMYRYWAVLCY
jgi:hypothetical protein